MAGKCVFFYHNEMNPALTIAIGLLTGAACAHYAKAQGRNPWRWFWVGFLFGVFGLLAIFFWPKTKKEPPAPAAPTAAPPALPPPAHADKLWYYLDEENQRHGPMSYTALRAALHEKKISEESYVWNEALDDWKRLGEAMSNE